MSERTITICDVCGKDVGHTESHAGKCVGINLSDQVIMWVHVTTDYVTNLNYTKSNVKSHVCDKCHKYAVDVVCRLKTHTENLLKDDGHELRK